MTVAEVLEQAKRLTPAEMRELAHELWVEADGPYEDPSAVEAAWAAEIKDRYEAIQDGSDPGATDAEFRQRFGL